ncbi:MAG: 6-bladed beta-propeller [bacterium]
MHRLMSGTVFGLLLLAPSVQGQDVSTVRNSFRPAAPPPELTVQVRVGASGSEEALLYGPRQMTVGEDGTLYVTDRGNKAIHMYAPDGTFLGRVGQEGGGPGEFQMPAGCWFTPDGRLAVKDLMNRRISFFTTEGSFLESEPMDGEVLTGATPVPIGQDRYMRAGTGDMVVMEVRPGAGYPPLPPLVEILDSEGDLIRTFGEPKPVQEPRNRVLVNTIRAAGKDGSVAVAFHYFDEIRIYDAGTGDLERVITRELAFTPRTPEMAVRDPGAVRAAADPVTFDIAYDGGGRLWVITALLGQKASDTRFEEGNTTGLVRMEVYGGDGRLIAAWTLQEPANQMAFAPDGSLWLLDSRYTNTARRCAVRWP